MQCFILPFSQRQKRAIVSMGAVAARPMVFESVGACTHGYWQLLSKIHHLQALISKSKTMAHPPNSFGPDTYILRSILAFLLTYPTRGDKRRAYCSKFFILALRLSHKKYKKCVLASFLGERPLFESDHYWREHGTHVFLYNPWQFRVVVSWCKRYMSCRGLDRTGATGTWHS